MSSIGVAANLRKMRGGELFSRLYDDTSKKLTWTITYWGLSDKAKAAHLHGPASEGANADKMITVSPLQSPIKGAAILTEEQVKALTGGDMYFDVHSAKQLKPAS